MTQEARDRNGTDLKNGSKKWPGLVSSGAEFRLESAVQVFTQDSSRVKSERTSYKSDSTLVLTVGSLSHKAVINQRGKVLLLRTGRPPKLDPAPPICTGQPASLEAFSHLRGFFTGYEALSLTSCLPTTAP